MKQNSLQAMLDRAKASGEALQAPTPVEGTNSAKSVQGSRRGTKLIGGHFAPEVSIQLRILAAEEGATVQGLLSEALDDLFVKKGRQRIASNPV